MVEPCKAVLLVQPVREPEVHSSYSGYSTTVPLVVVFVLIVPRCILLSLPEALRGASPGVRGPSDSLSLFYVV